MLGEEDSDVQVQLNLIYPSPKGTDVISSNNRGFEKVGFSKTGKRFKGSRQIVFE